MKQRLENLLEKNRFSSELDGFYTRLIRARLDKDDPIDITFRYFKPHSQPYYSVLRPVFLNQLSGAEVFSCFSPLLVRDGLLSLAYFFHRYPAPPAGDEDSFFIVNRRFAPFVPMAWKDHVAYYSLTPANTARQGLAEKNDVYLILTPIDERQCSLEFLRDRLQRLRDTLGARLPDMRFHVVTLLTTTMARDFQDVEAKSQYFFKSVMEIREHLGVNILSVSWDELQSRNLQDSHFLDLNEHDFYYSDSFVTHHLLSHGARPLQLDDSPPLTPELWIDASLYHGYGLYISEGDTDLDKKRRHVADELSRFLSTDLYRNEERAFIENPKSFFLGGLKFCPLSFETLIHSLAQELKKNCARVADSKHEKF
jgi:hypothetical protein